MLNDITKIGASLLVTAGLIVGGIGATDAAITDYSETTKDFKIVNSTELSGKNEMILSKETPKISFSKWNGRATMDVTYQGLAASTAGSRELLSNNVEWTSQSQTLQAVPIDGGIEINVKLTSRPAGNTFDFRLSNAEAFDFYYQPPLWQDIGLQAATKECGDTDCVTTSGEHLQRDASVVGSYAVYHKRLKNHIIGQMNYATGKAFHILRPKIVDAKGNETWGQLSYRNSTLTVTVPNTFLDAATYPVLVDPVVGYATIGGSSVTSENQDNLNASRYLVTENGTLSSLNVYAASTLGTEDIYLFAYEDNAGLPEDGNLLTSGQILNIGTTPAWNSVSVSGAVSPNNYWFGFVWNASTGSVYYDSVGKSYKTVNGGADYYTSLPDKWPNSGTDTLSTRAYSIYATYSETSRSFTTSSFSYCRTMTATAGGTSGGMATTTSMPFQLVATSTITELKSTTNGGHVQSLTTLYSTTTNGYNEVPNDIVFSEDDTCYASGSSTAIPHYFEKYASTTGAFTTWLLTSNISSTTNQIITMYYGNASASNLNSSAQVWATTTVNRPVGVWDMSQNPAAVQPTMLDSTYNYNHGTSFNSINTDSSNSSTTFSGYIDGALWFNGSNRYINAGSGASLDNIQDQGGGGMTVVFWANPTSNTTKTIMSKGAAAGGTGYWQILKSSATSPARISFQKEGTPDSNINFNSTLTVGVWQQIALVWNGSMTFSSGGVKMYKNAAAGVSNPATNGSLPNTDAGNDLTIGQVSGSYYDGGLDHIRIYASKVDAMDILTMYNNTANSAVFWTFGSETAAPVSSQPSRRGSFILFN